MIEDASGDLVDLIYYHHGCAPDDVAGWPAPESVDSPVYCGDPAMPGDDPRAGCWLLVDEVPLTAYGEAERAQWMTEDAR